MPQTLLSGYVEINVKKNNKSIKMLVSKDKNWADRKVCLGLRIAIHCKTLSII